MYFFYVTIFMGRNLRSTKVYRSMWHFTNGLSFRERKKQGEREKENFALTSVAQWAGQKKGFYL